MATYSEIKGQPIKKLASDPSDLVEGQVWFNTTDQLYKVVVNGVVRTIDVTGGL